MFYLDSQIPWVRTSSKPADSAAAGPERAAPAARPLAPILFPKLRIDFADFP